MRSVFSNIASSSVGKPAMRSAPKTMSGRSAADLGDERERVGAQMPALHALQDHVVARLQRQMQMRHQPLLLADARRAAPSSASIESIEERRRRVSSGTCRRIALHQLAEARAARQVGAVGGDVDAGQHDLAIAVAGEPPDLLDHGAHRHRARSAAAIGDDAEGAAVVAAVLHLRRRRARGRRCRRSVAGGLAHRHDVVDAHACRSAATPNAMGA